MKKANFGRQGGKKTIKTNVPAPKRKDLTSLYTNMALGFMLASKFDINDKDKK